MLSAAVLLLAGCSGSNDNPDEPIVVASTYSLKPPVVSDIQQTSVYLKSTFSATAGSSHSRIGFCYAIGSDPTTRDGCVDGEVSGNAITATVVNLSTHTTYRFRAFVVTAEGSTVYSEVTEATTADEPENELLANYIAPAYNDYYVSVADWAKRSQWNLANVHDPTVMLADDGYYYMYQTDASYGNAHDGHGHFHARRSKDLVNWEYLGGSMEERPAWLEEKCNEFRALQGLAPLSLKDSDCGYWAPTARNLGNGTYRMYYSIVVTSPIEEGSKNGKASWTEKGFIGLMETTNPASNQWEDKGFVVCSSTDRGNSYWCADDWANAYYRYNAIDPSYIITPEGEHWLIYGSWHSGIAALQLDAASGMPLNALGSPIGTKLADLDSYGTRIYTRQMNNRWQGSEGPEVVYRDGYYYLFLAYDALDIPYNTRVVRSRNVTGPYVGIDGTDVTSRGGDAFPIVTHPYKFDGDQGWVGISHCAVFDDGNDHWYFSSQGRMPANSHNNPYSNAIMLGHVRSILWTPDGWPVVLPERYGAVPDVPIEAKDLQGKWEHIDLTYVYGVQNTSVGMTLGPDMVTDGQWKGEKWSLDPTTNILTIGPATLMVARECDWESSPRKHTIVYAGINGKTTYWGKKL